MAHVAFGVAVSRYQSSAGEPVFRWSLKLSILSLSVTPVICLIERRNFFKKSPGWVSSLISPLKIGTLTPVAMIRAGGVSSVGTGVDGGASGNWRLSDVVAIVGVVGLGGGKVSAGVTESELSLLIVKSESVSASALCAIQRLFLRRGCCFRGFGARI